jgi:hypothetical protein
MENGDGDHDHDHDHDRAGSEKNGSSTSETDESLDRLNELML